MFNLFSTPTENSFSCQTHDLFLKKVTIFKIQEAILLLKGTFFFAQNAYWLRFQIENKQGSAMLMPKLPIHFKGAFDNYEDFRLLKKKVLQKWLLPIFVEKLVLPMKFAGKSLCWSEEF